MVHKLILGTVQMGSDYGINNSNGKINSNQSIEILNFAYKSGVRVLDTAEAYGDAHKIVGDYHRRYSHQKFNVITKLPRVIEGSIENYVKKYLDELKVPFLHGLMFHSFETYYYNPSLIEEISRIKESASVRHLGVSIYTNEEFLQLIKDDKIDIIQFPFNLLDNLYQRGYFLKEAKKARKILHSRSAFMQGLFFMDRNKNNIYQNRLINELRTLDNIAVENRLDVGAIALNYCLSQPEIDQVLIGVDSLDQLKLNIDYLTMPVASGVFNSINQIKVEDVQLLNLSLWK